MVGDVSFSARHETEEEQELRLQMLAEQEREAAYAAVSKAMATYRWWGFTAILCRVRMFITGIKLRLGMKLWP
jgi:hypothetical protein